MAFGGKKAIGKLIKLKESEYRFYGEYWKVDIFKIVSYNNREYKIISLTERPDNAYYCYLNLRETQDFEFVSFDIGL